MGIDKEAIRQGREFEHRVAKRIGAELVPNSGASWFAKLDLGRSKFVFSLKWTGASSFKLTRHILREVHEAILGPGGLGVDWTGAVIVEVDGVEYAVVQLDSFVDALKEDVRIVPTTKLDEKRARAHRRLLDIE